MSFKNSSFSSLFMFSIFFPCINSLFFNISSFDQGSAPLIECQGDAAFNGSRLKLTEDTLGSNITYRLGRAVYNQQVVLWDNKTRKLRDFTTHFSFIIQKVDNYFPGDGMTFFLAKHAPINAVSGGGNLGLYRPETNFSNSDNGVVAIEFDTFKNAWDPSANHVGIDVNSIVSVANISLDSSISDGRTANAWVTYHSSTKNLSVYLTYDKNPIYRGNSILSYEIDLRDFLPSKVAVGFSASTGAAAESHEIISWSFSSRLEGKTENPNSHTVAESPKKAESPKTTPENAEAPEKPKSPEAAKSPGKAEAPEKPKSPEAAKSPEKAEAPAPAPEKPMSPEAAKSPEKAEAPENPKSPEAAKSPEKAEAPENPKSPEAAKSPEISGCPDNTKKSNVGLIVGLAASIGAILFL